MRTAYPGGSLRAADARDWGLQRVRKNERVRHRPAQRGVAFFLSPSADRLRGLLGRSFTGLLGPQPGPSVTRPRSLAGRRARRLALDRGDFAAEAEKSSDRD